MLHNAGESGAQFTCFTSTKVQILTPEHPEALLRKRALVRPAEEEEAEEAEEAAAAEGQESRVELLVLQRKEDESEKSKRKWRSVSSLSRHEPLSY